MSHFRDDNFVERLSKTHWKTSKEFPRLHGKTFHVFNEKSLNIIAGNSGTELFSQIISGNFSTLYNLYESERGSDINDIQQVNDKSVLEVSMNLVTKRFTEDL